MFPFSFSVVRKRSSSSEVTFTVDGNGQWLIIGQSRSVLSLSPGEPELIHMNLLPIKTGWIALPKVTLQGVSTIIL